MDVPDNSIRCENCGSPTPWHWKYGAMENQGKLRLCFNCQKIVDVQLKGDYHEVPKLQWIPTPGWC